jgi:hypothetical protein
MHLVILENKKIKMQGVYWNSDMPYAFIDISTGDNPDEPSAGIASGWWLMANYDSWYFAWTDLARVSTHKDDYKVYIARGHHHDYSVTPRGDCTDNYTNPWCYYTDGPSAEPIGAWEGNAPETDNSWDYPTYDNPWVDPTNKGDHNH